MLQEIERETPENLPESVTENVTYWAEEIEKAKVFFKDDFERMRFNWRFARGLQWYGQRKNDDRYVANFVKQHIKNLVSSLYARNPTVVTKRKNKLNFIVWDETVESLQMAQQNIAIAMQSGMIPNPQDLAIIQDFQEGTQNKKQLDKISKTLDIVVQHEMDEQPDDFKLQMKQLIGRVATCGVGYIKTIYQREFESPRSIDSNTNDSMTKMQTINRLQSDLEEGDTEENSKETEDLRMALTSLQETEQVIFREGLIFEFPKATKIIIDPSCTNIEGFIDANWIAQEYYLTAQEIKEYYNKDIKAMTSNYREYNENHDMGYDYDRAKEKDGYNKVWEVQDKKTGMYFTICSGYNDYLKDPKSPDVELESFFNIKALVLNQAEDEEKIYPIADVELLKPIQQEYNRTKEALRQHRIANRPLYLAKRGSFEDEVEQSLINHDAHAIVYVNADGDAAVGAMVAPMQKAPIDPNVYESNQVFTDVQRVVGAPDSQFGGISGGTATENSIAAGQRNVVTTSGADGIDDFLTRVFRDVGVILLSSMSLERAQKIAGRGAVWPELSYDSIVEELYLSIEAGSSGRPNQAQDAATFERVGPLLLQMPNVNPTYLAKHLLKILDSKLDLTEAILEGNPSIMALNNMQQLGTGDPMTDPNNQGSQGRNNAQAGPSAPQASQSMFPALQNAG